MVVGNLYSGLLSLRYLFPFHDSVLLKCAMRYLPPMHSSDRWHPCRGGWKTADVAGVENHVSNRAILPS